MTWPPMMPMREIRRRGSSCRGLVWGETIRDHLLLATGYDAWSRIGLIGVRGKIALSIMGIRTAIMLGWASGVALPFFGGVHAFRRLRRR